MRSSHNSETREIFEDTGCNRLENGVKPQLLEQFHERWYCCNRLENAVKPQRSRCYCVRLCRCNRLENAVKPQPGGGNTFPKLVVTD